MDPVTPVFKLNKTVAGNTTRMAGRILDLDIDPSPYSTVHTPDPGGGNGPGGFGP
jgi:hypothetical protein